MSKTEVACVFFLVGSMLAGLGMFLHERSAHQSSVLTRQHRMACAEQGLPATECCRVGRAWVCPINMREPQP